jgi:hypothetical protein
MSACSSSTAPTVTADAAANASSYVPAIGGDAETGVQAILQDTGFDPAAPADHASALAAQLQQAQSLLVGMAPGAATTAGGDAAAPSVGAPAAAAPTVGTSSGPRPGAFRAELDKRAPIQLQPMQDGASAIANLDRIVQAREERVARIEEAFLTDPNATPADQQVLDRERQLLQDTRGLRDKLSTLAPTIDSNEAGAILQLVGSANQRGSYQPEQLAELMIQIEGSAHNLPASYLEAAMRAQDLLEQTRKDMDAMLEQLASSANGQLSAEALAPILEMEENQLRAQEALRANFELAKRDPAAAHAQLQQVAA